VVSLLFVSVNHLHSYRLLSHSFLLLNHSSSMFNSHSKITPLQTTISVFNIYRPLISPTFSEPFFSFWTNSLISSSPQQPQLMNLSSPATSTYRWTTLLATLPPSYYLFRLPLTSLNNVGLNVSTHNENHILELAYTFPIYGLLLSVSPLPHLHITVQRHGQLSHPSLRAGHSIRCT